MEVLILSGSVGKRSCTRTLLRHAQKCLEVKHVNTVWWDLGEKPLPIAVPEYHKNQKRHPNYFVREFTDAVKHADGFVLGSPLYHDSYSGVLKNALDTLPSKVFARKPVALVSHSSNARSCVAPCNQLRPVIRSLAGYATHHQVGTTDEDYHKTSRSIAVENPDVICRVDELIDELLAMSQLSHTTAAVDMSHSD